MKKWLKQKNMVEYEGRKVSLSQLAKLAGIDKSVLYVRYNRGYRGDKLIRMKFGAAHGTTKDRKCLQTKG